jgi:hypothetical protein
VCLPLLAWISGPMTPILALAATLLPFLVRRPAEPRGSATPAGPEQTPVVEVPAGSVAAG